MISTFATSRAVCPWSELGEQHWGSDGLVLHPSYGCWDGSRQSWRLYLQGVHYENGHGTLRQRLLVRLIRRIVRAPAAAIDGQLFQQRIVPFFREGVPQARVRVRLRPDFETYLTGDARDGRLRAWWEVPDGLVRELQQDGQLTDGWLTCTASAEDTPELECTCRIQLVPPQGVSIISDIDDTIKMSEVSDRRALLRNTFLREFRGIPGMAKVYRRWADAGAAFHYVSSSPAPLYEPLRDLMQREGFPLGSLHLRSLYLHNASLWQLLLTKPSSKRRMLLDLLRAFPHRQFVVIGDSGEKDPELYGSLARRGRPRIRRVLIRRTPGKRLHAERCRRVFRGVPFETWSVFQDAEQLQQLLPAAELRRRDPGPGLTYYR